MVLTIQKLDSELADNTELYNMAKSDSDIDSPEHINDETAKLETEVAQMEFRRMFNKPADPLNCFWTFKLALVELRLATGPACCCANTSNMQSAKALPP